MKKVFIHFVFIFCFTVLFSSCSKDNDANVLPCSTAWAADLQNEFTAISNAAAAFALDQSAANCSNLKAAYQDYIDALKPYGNCATLTGQNRADWQKALDEAEADVNSIC
jgi:hypothetical protein